MARKLKTIAGIPIGDVKRGSRRVAKAPARKPKPSRKGTVFAGPPAPAFERQQTRSKRQTRRARAKVPDAPKTAPGLPPRGDITSPKQIPSAVRKDFVRMERGDGRPVYVRKEKAKRIARDQQELAAARYLEARRTGGRNIARATPGPEDKDFKIGPLNIEAELEGRGVAMKVAETLKDTISRGASYQVKARKKMPGTSGGFSRVGPIATVSTGTGPAPEAVGRIGRDSVDLATQIVPSVYMTAAAIKEAAQGRPGRAKDLAQEMKDHDPIVLAAQGRFKEAGREVAEHPVIAALELSGARAVVGRGAGATVRGAGRAGRRGPKPVRRAAKRARQVGSTRRAPRRVPNTKIVEERSYSPDLIEKAIQVAVEGNRQRRSRKAGKQADAAARGGDAAGARELRLQATRLDPRLLDERAVGKRVDERVSVAEVRRRAHRSDALEAAEAALPKRRADVALLIAQGIVKPTKDGLRSYMKQIDGQIRSGDLPRAQKMAAKKLRKQLAEAIADKKIDFDQLVAAARDYAKVVNPRQKGLVDRGVLGEESEIAKLIPYAVREMEAKFEPKARKSQQQLDHEAIVGNARSAGRAARRADTRLEKARRAEAREEGKAQVLASGRRRAARTGRLGVSKQEAKLIADGDRDLTPAQGDRLIAVQANRVIAERRAASARKVADELAGQRQRSKPRKADRTVSPGLVDRDGAPLVAEEIKAHMRAAGVDPDDIAYVTQAPGQGGARNFFVNWQEPKGVPSTRRTGEATRRGTFDVSRETGVENVARMQGLADAFDEYAGFIDEAGYRPSGGEVKSFTSRKLADDFARNLDSTHEWRAVPTRPQFGRRDQSEALLDRANSDDLSTARSVQEGIADALAGKGDAGQWVLVPATAADRLARHTRLLGGTGTQVTRKAGKQFSAVVLTTNGFTWMLGNVLEAAVRSAVLRAGPGSYALGRKTLAELRKLDPELAVAMESHLGVGHIGAYQLNAIHTTAEVFNGTKMAPVARALGAFWRAPGPKQAAGLWDTWTRFVFGGNGAIERQFKTAMYGKYLSTSGRVKLDWSSGSKVLAKAAEQAAKGMKGTNEQVAAARFVRRAYGQYEAWSPDARFTIAVFTPFVAWSWNAVRFITSVLPFDHPVLTGLLAASASATEEWRNEMGLGRLADGEAPDWMQTSIPVGGKLYNIGRFTPFGFASDPIGTAGSLVLPQLMGTILATKGLDWKGDPIVGDSADEATGEDRLAEIARTLAGSFVPFFALRERVEKRGLLGGLNPVRGFSHDPKLEAAFNRREAIDERTEALRKQDNPKGGGKISADNPTPEYERLLAERRGIEAKIHKLSKGKYGKSSDAGSLSDWGGGNAAPASDWGGSEGAKMAPGWD